MSGPERARFFCARYRKRAEVEFNFNVVTLSSFTKLTPKFRLRRRGVFV